MRKFFLNIFIQAIIALVLLEIFFRVVAFVKVELLSPSAKKTAGVFTVLCVGDSTTEGLKVAKKFSYPSQLQELLKNYSPKKKFRVINIGHAGMSSSQVLNRFQKNIIKYRPDVIVLQVGINDPWNLSESNIWVFDQSHLSDKIKLKTDLFFSGLKVYRLARLLIISYKKTRAAPLDHTQESLAESFEFSEDKRKMLYKLLSYNINHMVFLAKQYNVPIFFQTYQAEGIGNPRDLINKVYRTLTVPVVDNQAVFDLATAHGLKVFSDDEFHPNEVGYGLIARNVYNMMVRQGMADSPPASFDNGIALNSSNGNGTTSG